MSPSQSSPGSCQRGAVTLMVGLMLVLGSSILALGVVQLGIMEQRIANNELRAQEARQAAQAGLEHALAWLGAHVWQAGAEPAIPTPAPLVATGDYRYSIELEVAAEETCLRIESRARAEDDPDIGALASHCVQQRRLLREGSDQGLPPLVMGGCLSNVTGNPAIHPAACSGDAPEDVCAPAAIRSSQAADCLDTGKLDLNGGTIEAEAFSGSAWDAHFAITKEEARALAVREDTNLHWIESSLDLAGDYGSPTEPSILFIATAAGCPKINGHVTIHGILYFESASGCGHQGWGGATIYGSVIFEGDVEKLTANSEFHHWSRAGGADGRADLDRVLAAYRVPGSWRDWALEP